MSHATWSLDDCCAAFPWVWSAGLASPIFCGTFRIHDRKNVVKISLTDEKWLDNQGFANFKAVHFFECSSCVFGGVILTGFTRSLKYSLHLPRLAPSLLSKTAFCSLMDLAVWMLLPRRPRVVYQNNLLACQYLESSLCPKYSQGCIFGFFTLMVADFRA